MPHAYLLEGNGGAKRRSCRPDGGAYDLPSPCRIPSVRPPTSDCRPQGGHPCIERMRDAHGRSNIPQTAPEAFHGNENGKGTPSGVPQPIHKRKLILVEEEFDASSSGGDEENRTPV